MASDPSFHVDDDPWASHPPTDQRIARLAELTEATVPATDDRPARVLWQDPDGWTQRVHERWLELLVGGRTDFRVVDWDAFGSETAGRTQRANAGEVDGALRRMGLAPGACSA